MKITKRKDGRYATSVQYKGKRKYFIGKEKKEVEAQAIEYMSLHNKGIELNDSISFSLIAKEWFKTKQSKNSKKTQIEVQRLLNNYIVKSLGDYPIKNLRSLHVQNMLNEISDKPNTCNKVFKYTKTILEFAVENDYCLKNVAKTCTVPRVAKKEKSILSKEEIYTLENSTNKYRDFFVFLLYTGLRRGEVAGLKWSDIDLQNNEIHITRAMSFISNKGELKSTKTKKDRIIPILGKTRQILERQPKSEYVFTKQDGKHLTESAIDRMHESILKDTGLHFKLHELRHTFCTILYYAGISPLQASSIMGHSLSVMQEIYTHLDKDKSKQEIQKLNDYVSKN